MSASQLKVMEQQDEPEVEDGAGGGMVVAASLAIAVLKLFG